MKKEKILIDYLPKKISRPLQTVFENIIVKARRKNMIALYKGFGVVAGDLVFDIGAYRGLITDVLLSIGAKVVAVEPNPEMFASLQKKFQGNPDVVLLNMGVGKEECELEFHVNEKVPQSCTFSEEFITDSRYSLRKWEKTVKVPVTTLDALIDKHGTPKYIKIDVEGYEWNVIQGLTRKVPCLTYEFHREFMADTKKCAAHLAGLGKVSFNYNLELNYKSTSPDWLTLDALFADLESREEENLKGDIIVKME
ncbi:MAG: FkbM family methyltransferase [Candidatus Lokiarchaeota archaeon]|nr:FkbM family methyltransferase [Candidatus Lokiarchaeota archaeon]